MMRTIKTYSKGAPFYNALTRLENYFRGTIYIPGRLTSACFRLERRTRRAPKCSRRDGGSRAHRPPCGLWEDRSLSDAAYRFAGGGRPAPCLKKGNNHSRRE